MDSLKERVLKFMSENKIDCEETIYQSDRVLINATDFISDLYSIVKYELEPDPPSFGDLPFYFKAYGVNVAEITHKGEISEQFTVAFRSISIDVPKHHYCRLDDYGKKRFLRNIKEVIGIGE